MQASFSIKIFVNKEFFKTKCAVYFPKIVKCGLCKFTFSHCRTCTMANDPIGTIKGKKIAA